MDISAIAEIVRGSTATVDERLRAQELISRIESEKEKHQDEIRSSIDTKKLEYFKAALNPALAAAVISVVTLLITNSFNENQAKASNQAGVALENLKFQYEILRSTLSENPDGPGRANALMFLADIKVLKDLDHDALVRWAQGTSVPQVGAVASPLSGGITVIPRRPQDKAQVALLNAQAREAGTDLWMSAAIGEIGVLEDTGEGSSADVIRYAAETGIDYRLDDTPWPGLYVAWVFSKAGYDFPDAPLASRSWLNWGYAVQKPIFGSVAVFWRGAPDSKTGVVGLYVGEDVDSVHILSGNIFDSVAITRIPKEKLLGYRLPTGFHQVTP